MDKLLEIRLGQCRTLPSLPGVAVRVLELYESQDASLQQVADAISCDPALTAKLLRVANSPFYGVPRKVATLSRAITLLGTYAVLTLALSFSLVRGLRHRDKSGFNYKRYWRRAILSAVAARALGRWARLPNSEELFLAALLQDIGMLALDEVLGSAYRRVMIPAEDSHEQLPTLERQALGVDHAEVGAWLAQRWHLPQLLRLAILGSHDPSSVEESSEHRLVIQCVALSGAIAEVWLARDPADAMARAHGQARTVLGMDGDALKPVLEDVNSALAETSALFEVDLGRPGDLARILEQAKEALVLLNMRSLEKVRETERAAEDLAVQNRILEERSQRDALTGIYNRLHLDSMLSWEFKLATQAAKSLSVLFCDIDYFKKVNDNFGHAAGDAVLISVAGVLASSVRDTDLVARYGGEEFVILLPETDGAGAALVSERVRHNIAASSHTLPTGERINVTISIGHSSHSAAVRFADPETLLQGADAALRAAKLGGRNRVVAYAPHGVEDATLATSA